MKRSFYIILPAAQRQKSTSFCSTSFLLSQDGYGLYDETLNAQIWEVVGQIRVPPQFTTISGFGSDGSVAMKNGHVACAACLGFSTQNTHRYEIASLGAIANCIDILKSYCSDVTTCEP